MARSESKITVYEYIVSTMCETGGFCQFAIAAKSDTTRVSVTFPSHVPAIVFCIGQSKFTANGTTVVTLMKFEAVQFESAVDLSGTHIYSKKQIAVFVGTRNCAKAPATPLIEQLVPSSQWGREVVIPKVAQTVVVKIVSNYNHTKLRINRYPEVIISKQYQPLVRRFEADIKYIYIKANQTIQVLFNIRLLSTNRNIKLLFQLFL